MATAGVVGEGVEVGLGVTEMVEMKVKGEERREMAEIFQEGFEHVFMYFLPFFSCFPFSSFSYKRKTVIPI